MAEKANSEELILVDPSSDFEDIGLCSSLPVVVNGLKLKKSHTCFKSFDYRPALVYPADVTPLGWHVLSISDMMDDHIRIHELQDGENLLECAKKYHNNHAKAMIIISSTISSDLSQEQRQSLQKLDHFLVAAVLTNPDGMALLECIQNVEGADEKLFGRLEAANAGTTHRHIGSNVKSKAKDIFLKLLPSHSNWTTSIEKLMFDGDKMFVISTDKLRFASIMEQFSNYEIVENLNPFLINELIKKWNWSLKEFSFKREFPFFLVLLYRFLKYHQKYKWDEIEPFLIFCIEMFEQLIPDELAETLISFLKMKDFDVSFGDKKANTSVFVLLTKACKNLMKFSENFKCKKSKHVLPKRLLYSKMLWISVYLKCLGIKRNITKTDLEIWHTSFMKVKLGVHVNEQTISNELKQGLSVAVQLELPFEHQFSLNLLVEFLVMKMGKRPLSFISNIIIGSEEIIRSHEELMSYVLINLRSHDNELLQSSDLIVQGISFLESMSKLRMKKKWIEEVHWKHFRNECLEWIAFLIGTIDVTNSSAPQLLKTFLKPTKGSMIDDAYFRRHSINLIMEKIQKSFPKLTIQLFLSLCNLSTEWPELFLSDYLKRCLIPSKIKINDCKWSDFFETIFDHNHSDAIFFEFLERVSDQYRTERRACDLIPNLLQLKFPDLFFTDAEAVQNEANACGKKYFGFLKRYIRRNDLHYKIIRRIHEIITSISEDKQTQNHTIVFSVLYLEIVPELNSSVDIGEQNIEKFKCVLELSVDNICQKLSLSESLSPQINFYWGVIAAWCNKIPVKNEKFDWIMHLMPIILKLLTVFNTYCEVQKLSDEDRLFTTAVPQEIACRSCDVQRYFLWVKAIQSVLLFWQDKLRGKRVNYDEIQMYYSNHEIIVRVGQAVYAERYIIDLEGIKVLKREFALCFENLNYYLVQYVSDHPEVSYCILPELLLYYGVSLPQGISEVLRKNVIFPGNESNDHQNIGIHFAENSRFNPNQNISLKIKISFYLSDINEVLKELDLFLEPITNHMEMLVFFHLHKSEIFETHIWKLLGESMPTSQHLISRSSFPSTRINDTEENKERLTINDFQCALSGFKDFLLMVIKGKATYSNINANGALQLESLKLEDEVAVLTMFSESFELLQGNYEGLEGLKSMLELFQLLDHIVHVQQVFKQYGLEVCLEDESLREMIAIAEEMNLDDSRSHLTLTQAKEKMAFLKEIIHQQLKCTNYACFSLFPTVANSMAFYQFIKAKHFYGSKGLVLFHEHYQLVTAQLQHEKYDENVLNHLRVAYELMTPFMEKSISFCDLLDRISRFDVTKGLKQLETVNENILLIQLWFSKAKGDTIENVEKELEDILSTGTFQFQLCGCSRIQLVFLMLQNTGPQRKTAINGTAFEDSILKKDDSSCSSTSVGVEQKWTNEQITDFVRKLGFLDTKTEGGEKIRQFLYLNLIANRLSILYSTLSESGHAYYQKNSNPLSSLPCKTTTAEADTMVYKIQETLIGWQKKIIALRQKYILLLLFSVPKTLHIYSLFTGLKENLHSIVLAVSLLFENTNKKRDMLEGIVKANAKVMEVEESGHTPMEFIGQFLNLICGEKDLCKRRRSSQSDSFLCLASHSSKKISVTDDIPFGFYKLHCAYGYSKSQLICLITDIYKGVPECYEVFHCRPSNTQEDIKLFVERIKHYPLTYLMLQVNKLPFNLQELLITLLKQVCIPEGFQKHSSVNFIETAPSMFREAPWISQECRDSEHKLLFDEAASLYGKTYYIRQKLAKSSAGVTICINESFTPLHAIISLNKLPDDIVRCAVFFNFTLMPYQELQDEIEKKKAAELIEEIGWFFYHFLVLGYVEDPVTGISFRFPGGQQWAIYIEVPSLDHEHKPEESLGLFMECFPTLRLLGSSHLIDPAIPMTVDEDVQLVCKYLRAYKIGGIKGIDKIINNKGLVKFSTEPDLSDNECHELLLNCIPEHIRKTKITQKIFIRYMSRRCTFLDNLPSFNRNTGFGEIIKNQTGEKVKTDTRQLGSILMKAMLDEVETFCDPVAMSTKEKAKEPHQQLIYDLCEGGESLGLLSSQPENIPEDQKKKFESIGLECYSSRALEKRETLDQILARALGLPLEDGKRLSIIDDCNYVLTLDYAIKMLNIHERYCCGVSVILEGETGVGKTALMEMLSKLWSSVSFHKLNVHAALTPQDIKRFFERVFKRANEFQIPHQRRSSKITMPLITVFLDEINTSSCLGLFKEIIVDKTLDGNPIPNNVFIVAACNPHRCNSMATHATETWIRSSYQVRPLHPTLWYLKWDYGSLDQYQERDYVRAKLQMLNRSLPNLKVVALTELIVESQILMREYALNQLRSQRIDLKDPEISSKSCVSQRDIQRVFTFYKWLMSVYDEHKQQGNRKIDHRDRALMVSLGIVYYMRLNSEYRRKYEQVLDKKASFTKKFSEVFTEELDYFCENIHLPTGIARTQPLKENLFAIIVCTLTRTPLIIIGAPGSSKTISFNQAINNLKGPESKSSLFRDTNVFKSLDPHFYQCSRRTTSHEVRTVFSRAINRQKIHDKFSLPIYCVVFMDEAGLPEESHESLKVLHYYLDKQEVSFVAITNHVLDAAKTNRAVSLFRPEVTEEDLRTLAKGCLTPNPENPQAYLRRDLETIVEFCPAFSRLIKDRKLKSFFGLRDFIHFIHFLRKRRTKGITPQLVAKALERNFNGEYWSDQCDVIQEIYQPFFEAMGPQVEEKLRFIQWRGILDILKDSFKDHSEGYINDNEDQVRYKLIIDPIEDNSLIYLLMIFGVLDRENTRIYTCSKFAGDIDSHMQKVSTIAAIRHSMFEGHKVVLSQADEIHESFYDLFNQRFHRINDPEHGPRYFANIAIGAYSKPCQVHPDFSCVVVIKKTEVNSVPPPFLNRFEKYFISHEMLLDTALNHLQPCVRIIIQTAREKVNEFINVVGRDNRVIYGIKPQTLDSLILSLLPPYGHTYLETPPEGYISDDVKVCLLHDLLRAMRNSAGFSIRPIATRVCLNNSSDLMDSSPITSIVEAILGSISAASCSSKCVYSIDELKMDGNHLFPMQANDAKFEGALDLLSIDTINVTVNEAMHILHKHPNPNEHGVATSEMSHQACFVIFILQQWLIRHLCKNVMQLMTPEGVCLHHKKIPTSLIDDYLTNQHHFSLKKLVQHHLSALETSQSTCLHPNKLLCFTRSSPIIHNIPATYPHSAALKVTV